MLSQDIYSFTVQRSILSDDLVNQVQAVLLTKGKSQLFVRTKLLQTFLVDGLDDLRNGLIQLAVVGSDTVSWSVAETWGVQSV